MAIRRKAQKRSAATPSTSVDRLIAAGGSSPRHGAPHGEAELSPVSVLLRLPGEMDQEIRDLIESQRVKNTRHRFILECIDKELRRLRGED